MRRQSTRVVNSGAQNALTVIDDSDMDEGLDSISENHRNKDDVVSLFMDGFDGMNKSRVKSMVERNCVSDHDHRCVCFVIICVVFFGDRIFTHRNFRTVTLSNNGQLHSAAIFTLLESSADKIAFEVLFLLLALFLLICLLQVVLMTTRRGSRRVGNASRLVDHLLRLASLTKCRCVLAAAFDEDARKFWMSNGEMHDR